MCDFIHDNRVDVALDVFSVLCGYSGVNQRASYMHYPVI